MSILLVKARNLNKFSISMSSSFPLQVTQCSGQGCTITYSPAGNNIQPENISNVNVSLRNFIAMFESYLPMCLIHPVWLAQATTVILSVRVDRRRKRNSQLWWPHWSHQHRLWVYTVHCSVHMVQVRAECRAWNYVTSLYCLRMRGVMILSWPNIRWLWCGWILCI